MVIALFAGTLAFSGYGASGPLPPDRGYTQQICMQPENWPRLRTLMVQFGAAHAMDFHGEIVSLPDAGPDKKGSMPELNFALIKGLHQLGGDDFDLWLVPNPFKPTEVSLSVVTRAKITAEQLSTASAFKLALRPLTCESEAAPSLPRQDTP